MTSSQPQISVVMPVRNARPFLDEAINSILSQTFHQFEFVILDDASTDGSLEVLRKWKTRDSRIRLYEVKENLGLSGSSNFVVQKATAPIIARMDADDVSHPERLQRQWELLQHQPEVVAVGTLCEGIDAAGKRTRPRDRWRLIRHSPYIPFPHGSVMFRREAFDNVEGYSDEFAGGEDQQIFFKMRAQGRVVTLPNTLYTYRFHSLNATRVTGEVAVKAVQGRHSGNGNDLSAFYMLGAMRLWAGESPQVLDHMLAQKHLKWNLRSLMALAVAACGNVSPGLLRFSLRTLLRARDLAAGTIIKEGTPYEWRYKS